MAKPLLLPGWSAVACGKTGFCPGLAIGIMLLLLDMKRQALAAWRTGHCQETP
jgi:hypothetical protein